MKIQLSQHRAVSPMGCWVKNPVRLCSGCEIIMGVFPSCYVSGSLLHSIKQQIFSQTCLQTSSSPRIFCTYSSKVQKTCFLWSFGKESSSSWATRPCTVDSSPCLRSFPPSCSLASPTVAFLRSSSPFLSSPASVPLQRLFHLPVSF